MPTYEYACKSCGQHLEVVQSFKDAALTSCPACDGPLRKVFGSIGIAFKGSGFYRNDNRTKPSSEGSSKSESKAPKADTKSDKSEAKDGSGTSPAKAESGTGSPAKSGSDSGSGSGSSSPSSPSSKTSEARSA